MLVTNGGKHAVYNTFQVLCDPGDEVLLPAPYWTSYPEVITLGGGVPVVLPTTEATGFRVSIEQLDAAVTPRTKALLFVSPSNPTGAVYPPDEVEAIGRWALERGIWVVTDEIYEHLTYDGHVFSSMPGLVPELAEHVRDPQRCRQDVRDDGLARRLDDRSARRHRGGDQPAIALHVERVERRAGGRARRGRAATSTRSREMREAFARRGKMMCEMLSAASPASTCLEPQGAFYCFPSFEGVLGREIGGRRPQTTLELCEVLLEVAKVAIVPGRGVRRAGLRPAELRARRRRPRRRHPPDRRRARRLVRSLPEPSAARWAS